MEKDSFVAFVNNAALLLAIISLYDLIRINPLNFDTKLRQIVTGVCLSIIAIAVMSASITIDVGVVFDTRSIIISISGLFFGTLPTIIVILLASIYRFFQGGAFVTGIFVIISSGVIGLILRHSFNRPLIDLTWKNMLVLGYTVHIAMLILMFTLPLNIAFHVLREIALPVLTIYPLVTVAIGALIIWHLKRDRIAEELQKSEIQFRALSEQAAIGVNKTKTATGEYVFVNQRFADIVGYSREELLGMNFQALTFHDDLASDLANMDRLVKGELNEYSTEKRYRRKDGTVVWVSLTVSPLSQGKEAPEYLIGVVEDISVRKHVEEELSQSDDKYRMLMEGMKDVVWTLDTETMKILYISPSVERLLGYTSEEVMAIPIQNITSPSGFSKLISEMEKELLAFTGGMTTGTFYTNDVEQVCKDGQRVWTEMITSYYCDPVSKHIIVHGVSRDISERKRISSELAESREELLEAQAIGHVGTWSVDPDTRDFLWSDSCYVINCITVGTKITHEYFVSLIHPNDRVHVWQEMMSVMKKEEEFSFDYRIVCHNGTERYIALNGKVSLDFKGKHFIRGTMQDITERVIAEKEKNAMQMQLLQSQKMEAIGQLAGGIAHDFNNLLTAILGNIELIRNDLAYNDPHMAMLDAIESAGRHAAELTRGLLTFSRSAVVVPRTVNINAIVTETLDLLRQSLPATMDIERDFEPNCWNVMIDRAQITQILLNIAVNARDAMNGMGTLSVSIRNNIIDDNYIQKYPFAKKGEHVHIRVSDTGSGIPDEIMEHLFEPFHTTKPVGSGTGLGLSVIYGAVKQAGGWITVETGKGTGTSFDIFFPRCLADETPELEKKFELKPETITHSNVLVVDDESSVADIVRLMLKRGGIDVIVAKDGTDALDCVSRAKGSINAVILDMTMPGMTTEEIVDGIRAIDVKIPILLNSGYTSGDLVKQMLDDGKVQGFLEKPYTLQQLMNTVVPLINPRMSLPADNDVIG